VPTKISKKVFFFVPSKCQKNKENLFYYRSKLFIWLRITEEMGRWWVTSNQKLKRERLNLEPTSSELG
jgi:hypothetical protein